MKCFITTLLLFTGLVSGADFQQKVTTRYALDAAAIPREVSAGTEVIAWESTEQGPVEGLKEFARTEGGIVWLGGEQGAARFDPNANHRWDRWQYFHGKRWLADNDVQNIFVDPGSANESVWIRTRTGVSNIEWRPMSFGDKAWHYDEIVEARHVRHGFVAKAGLSTAGDLSTSFTRDNDNDGLWTAMYLAAQAYRYAATKDPDARAKARRSLDAIIRLEEINGMPGYYSRSFVHIGEPSPDPRHWGKENERWKWISDADPGKLADRSGDWVKDASGDFVWRDHEDPAKWIEHSGEWHATNDGKWLWKSDTSSDETIGHFLAYALYFDLVADADEKEFIRKKVRLITNRMMRDNYYLLDVDGKPTRWGNWNMSYYRSEEGAYERALRSLELLSFLKTAYHVTGDETYQSEYLRLVSRGDIEQTNKYRRWASAFVEINHSDDELYYLSVLPLMLYENDPALRARYLAGMRFTWGEIAREMNPLWNFINAACGIVEMNPRILDESLRTLKRSPWEAVEWRVENSHRIDFAWALDTNRKGRREFTEAIPPDERRIHKHNTSPYEADGGTGGLSEEAPTYWLLPYWMGRYYGWVR